MSEQYEQKPSLILCQFTLKTAKSGAQYFSGKLGMTWVRLVQSKNNPEKWNLFMEQAEQQPQQVSRGFMSHEGQ